MSAFDFNSDTEALELLSPSRFFVSRGGVITPVNPSIEETADEEAAINYLILEWDYDYDDVE